MKKRWKIGLVLRRILVIFLLLLEIALLGFVIFSNGKASSALQVISFVLGLILALKIAVEHHKSGYKTMWILLSLLFPILGIALYWLQI